MSARCPRCGLAGLPDGAAFCAGCGAALAPRRIPPPATWVVLLFWLGSAAALLTALGYGALVLQPGALASAGASGVELSQLRSAALLVAIAAALLGLAQLVAAAGLSGRRAWARVLATLVCVAWSLTCVGLPLALFALQAIWPRRAPARREG